MQTDIIRQRLHQFIEGAEENKLKAIYTLLEEQIEQNEWEYTDEFKVTLDKRYEDNKHGKGIVSGEEANRQIGDLLNKKNK